MSAPPSSTPRLFAGRYVLERLVGEGATATVHLASDTRRGTAVAIKLLRPELVESSASARFLREIRRTSRLEHPHIVPVLDADVFEGQPYFVLPYMEGGTLRLRLRRERQLELTDAVTIARTVGEALDYAHGHGLVHCDVKPENILFTSGQAVLADFGISRALEALSGELSSSSGVIRGTPAYMSPEQAAGSKNCDGRSDIYSLACVVYEMITGMQAFMGPTPQSVIAQRFAHAPREVRVYRPSAPVAIDAVLAKAFAMTLADRYQTAGELVAALAAAVAPVPLADTGSAVQITVPPWYVRRATISAGSAALAASLIATWVSLRNPELDAGLYIVAPFNVSGRPGTPTLDGASVATLAYDALRRWPDLLRVDPLRVNDLVSRRGGPPTSLGEAFELARSARAARLVWGDLHKRGDATVIRGVLYDVARPRVPPREASVTLRGVNDDSLSLRLVALVDSLVAGAQPRPPAGSTKRFAAVSAYAAGMSALNGWDLRAAQQHFRAALETEPNYAAASLRLAQVSQWLRAPADEWRLAAASAAASGVDLSVRDRLHGSALLAMAAGDYPRACWHYTRLAAADTLDFAAWFGLGECRLQDRLVIRDPSSSSGWRFRSSRHAAAQAYSHALEIVPTSYRAYRDMIAYRLDKAFITRLGHFRDGVTEDRSAGVFGAFPELTGDTIAFVPYPYAEYITGTQSPRATAVGAALESARRQVAALSDRWVRTSPESPDAWEARALALERAGVIVGHRDRSAIGSIGRARRLAIDRRDSVSLATTEVRLRIKAGQFREAGRLADSVIRRWTDPEPELAGRLAHLAALLGRLGDLERLLERAAPLDSSFVSLDGRMVRPSAPLAALALQLTAYSALGGSRDTIEALERRIEQHLASIPNVAERDVMRDALTRNAGMVAFPRFGARPIHSASRSGGYLITFQSMLARGDTARLHRDLIALEQQRKVAGVAPGAVSVDAAYLEASLLLQLRDSARAAVHLDDVLENLAAQREDLLDVLHRPVTLVSAMELRAALAARSRNQTTAHRWRAAITDLRGTVSRQN